jgi:hypothetical protein
MRAGLVAGSEGRVVSLRQAACKGLFAGQPGRPLAPISIEAGWTQFRKSRRRKEVLKLQTSCLKL